MDTLYHLSTKQILPDYENRIIHSIKKVLDTPVQGMAWVTGKLDQTYVEFTTLREFLITATDGMFFDGGWYCGRLTGKRIEWENKTVLDYWTRKIELSLAEMWEMSKQDVPELADSVDMEEGARLEALRKLKQPQVTLEEIIFKFRVTQ